MQSKLVMLLVCSCVAASDMWSEDHSAMPWREPAPALVLTGNSRIDFVGLTDFSMQPLQEHSGVANLPGHKSPWLAAGFSAVLPGAGEFYSERYVKSAIFLAVEVAAWAVAYAYDKKGDKQTDFFQDYANVHWSVVRYGQYALSTFTNLPNPPYRIFIAGREGSPPWDQVNWNELNRMERDIAGYYSHTLPPYGDQQYYELIGKYPQFNQGWDDANPNPNTFTYGDPLTARFQYYAAERGKANQYYNNASTAIAVVVVNHILSAIDGAWSAASFNKDLQARVGLQSVSDGFEFVQVPVVKLTYSF